MYNVYLMEPALVCSRVLKIILADNYIPSYFKLTFYIKKK